MKIVENQSWHWAVLILCLLPLTFSGVKQEYEQAHRQYGELEKADWLATNVWIEAAECARETGAWLTICDNGKLSPIANHAGADDPGHALLLGLAARLKNESISLVDVAKLNILINLVGILSVVALLFSVGYKTVSLLMLIIVFCSYFFSTSLEPYFAWVGIAPHPGLVGAASMAFIFPITILLSGHGYLTGMSRVLFLVMGAGLMGLASLIREPIGVMGVVVSVGAIIYLACNKSDQRWKLLIMLTVVILAWQSPRWVLMARDAFFPIEPVEHIQTHGMSHTLYLGLGAAGDNKFGIRWLDSDAADAVKEVDESIAYVSPAYYQNLWRLYFDLVKQDPVEVGRIYYIKLTEMLQYRLPDGELFLWQFLIGCGVLLAVAYHRRFWKTINLGSAPVVIITALAFIGLFIVQGIIAHPSPQYAYPIGGFVFIIWAVGLEVCSRCVIKKVKEITM